MDDSHSDGNSVVLLFLQLAARTPRSVLGPLSIINKKRKVAFASDNEVESDSSSENLMEVEVP